MLTGRRVAVVGAGLMGHGVAQVFAEAAADVKVHDPDAGVLNGVRARVRANLQQLDRDLAAAERIRGCERLADAVDDAEMVIEAAPEDPELKASIFAELDELAPHDAILATNTSVIPVGRIAQGVSRRDRVIGTHWWNPPHLIPLVEVVQGEDTSGDVVTRTIAMLREAGKAAVHVKRDLPGFVGNRLQHALWREAIALVADGVCDAETLDTIVKQSFGARLGVLGPLENADLVGLELTLAIHEQVLPHLDRTPGPSPYLRRLVAEGRLGMSSGAGFRTWSPDEPERVKAALTEHLCALANDTSTIAPVGTGQAA